ncbi:mechanosensitive ion channel [soil metagenome]
MDNFLQTYLFNQTSGKITAIVISSIIIWLIVKFVKSKFASRITVSDSRYRLKKFLDFGGYFLMILMITIVFSDKLGSFTVALGVAGAGIAFALQEVIASIAGWIAIMFGGFYRTGDRVQLGGIKGDVIDIGVLRTTLMEIGQWVDGDLYNGRIVLVANSFVFKEPVFNYSSDFQFLWDEIKVPIMFGSDYNAATSLFEGIATETLKEFRKNAQAQWEFMLRRYMIEDMQIKPMVTLTANDNWVEYTIRYIVDFKKRRSTKDILFKNILEAVENSEGKIKFASSTMIISEIPPLNVKFSGDRNS